MGVLLCFSFVTMLVSTVVGVLAGRMILRLFRIYDRLPEKIALSLKIMTLGPPLVLTVLGLIVSLDYFIWMIFYYIFAGLLACSGCVLVYRDQSQDYSDRQVGLCLAIAATLPFIWVGSDALVMYLGPGTFSFHIENHSGPEIAWKEVQVDGQVVFTGEHRSKRLLLKRDLSRWPRTIKLLVYDGKLQKEVRASVSLPFSNKHALSPFYIVYKEGGFHYDDRPYP